MATLSADFTIADGEWPKGYKEIARLQFKSAIVQWKLLYRIWRSQIEHDAMFHYLRDEMTDPELISEAAIYLPELANAKEAISYRKVEHALMATAAKDVSSALADIDSPAK